LWSFGIFFHVLVCCIQKNLATLRGAARVVRRRIPNFLPENILWTFLSHGGDVHGQQPLRVGHVARVDLGSILQNSISVEIFFSSIGTGALVIKWGDGDSDA
jgi:hypothetical protein